MEDTAPRYVTKKQSDIWARFHIGSSTPDLPAFGTPDNNNSADSPFVFDQHLPKVGTQASLATYTSSIQRNDEPR